MTAEFSDISVGVHEGRTDGNTLIIRTVRGKTVVDGAVRDGFLEVGELPEANLEHLKTAAGNKKRRAMDRARAEGMLNPSNGRSAYIRLTSDPGKGSRSKGGA